MMKSGCTTGIEKLGISHMEESCDHCCNGKMKNETHSRSIKEDKELLELVYTDLSGKNTPKAYNGDQYF